VEQSRNNSVAVYEIAGFIMTNRKIADPCNRNVRLAIEPGEKKPRKAKACGAKKPSLRGRG
jgi:hypothetical protein